MHNTYIRIYSTYSTFTVTCAGQGTVTPGEAVLYAFTTTGITDRKNKNK